MTKFLSKIANTIIQTANSKYNPPQSCLEKIGQGISTDEFQKIVKEISENYKKPLILAFDEADSLEFLEEFKEKVLYLCFKILVEQKDLIVIFAHEKESIFWNEIWKVLRHRPITLENTGTPLLSKKSTIDLATLPANLVYTPLAEEYLWRISGGYPALIQLICHHLVRYFQTETLNPPGIVRVLDLRKIVGEILDSEEDIKFINYLKDSFDDEERRILITLVDSKKVDYQTGEISSLFMNPDGSLSVDSDLFKKYLEDWKELRLIENGSDKNEQELVKKELEESLQCLFTKQIISYIADEKPGKKLRLRVGLLFLFLDHQNC